MRETIGIMKDANPTQTNEIELKFENIVNLNWETEAVARDKSSRKWRSGNIEENKKEEIEKEREKVWMTNILAMSTATKIHCETSANYRKKNITARGRRNNARVYYVLKVP